MLNRCVKKLFKGGKFRLVLHQVANVSHTEKDTGLSMKVVHVEKGTLVVVFDERITGLNHKKDVYFRRNVEASVIKVLENKSL